MPGLYSLLVKYQLIQSSKHDSVKQSFLVRDLSSGIGSIEEYVQLTSNCVSKFETIVLFMSFK